MEHDRTKSARLFVPAKAKQTDNNSDKYVEFEFEFGGYQVRAKTKLAMRTVYLPRDRVDFQTLLGVKDGMIVPTHVYIHLVLHELELI